MRVDISWIQRSNGLSLLRKRLTPRLVDLPQKLNKTSCGVFLPICHRSGVLSLLYTRRTETLNSHTGQISFPGGRCDEGETAQETSIREMDEEIGVQPHSVWGCLSRPVMSLKLDNVYGCVGYIGHYEDHNFTLSAKHHVSCANNLLSPDVNLKWSTKEHGVVKASVELKLPSPCRITGVQIVNNGSAFVAVSVSLTGCPKDSWQELIETSQFMNPSESKSGSNLCRTKVFSRDKIIESALEKTWDKVKVTCMQPYNKTITFGLSSLSFDVLPLIQNKPLNSSKKILEQKPTDKLSSFLSKVNKQFTRSALPGDTVGNPPCSVVSPQRKTSHSRENKTVNDSGHQPQTALVSKQPPLPSEGRDEKPKLSNKPPLTSPPKTVAMTTNQTDSNVPPSITREMCELKRWGLPRDVLGRYNEAGITHMFPWQAECLSLDGVLSGKNLVYCAPTSAGKTLVAELLLLKRVLETRQKVLFILPFVSVAGEKTSYLQGILEGTGLKIGGFFGTKGPAGGISKVDIAVCTIEKGNGIVNRMVEKGELGEVGCVVVDEVHMVGDSSRGYLLELLLTKLLYHSRQTASSLQIVGMSATLPNLDLLSRWLDAALYTTDFRPVPLTQFVKTGNIVYDITGKPLRELPSQQHDHLVLLCQETLTSGHNVLVFAPNKAWTERLCELVAGAMETSCLDVAGLNDIVSQLERLPMTLDPVLARTVRCGIAYHHAGLTVEEREVVESGFRRGIIRVLIATTTLSAGVNLPARRVIIRSPKAGPNYMSPLLYQQMSGRAGRMGVDEAGESVLICGPGDGNAVARIVSNVLNHLSSCLGGEFLGTAMKRAMLEVIAGGMVSREDDVIKYFQCTLLAAEEKQDEEILKSALEFLTSYEFISEDIDAEGCKTYKATKLGCGTLNSSLPPGEALELLTHLQKARRNFNLETELQLVYEVTPLSFYKTWSNPDWYCFYSIWCGLSPAHQRAAENVGVNEGFLVAASSRMPESRTDSQRLALQTHIRFFAALALLEVIEEVPIDQIARKYSTNRGQLQSLQSSASSYAGQVAVFCDRLGFSALGLLLSDLQVRLFSGVHRELCDLVRVQLITGPLARVLYNAGYTGVAQLSSADPDTIKHVLQGVLPFASEREGGGRSWLAKRHGLTELEAAANMIDNAKELLQDDLCQMNVQVNLSDILQKNKSGNTTNALYSSVGTGGKRKKDQRKRKTHNTSIGTTEHQPTNDNNEECISVLDIPEILTPHKPRKSVLLRASSSVVKPGKEDPSPKDKASSTKRESIDSNCLDISSQFDEINLSAWDFLDIDKDLLAISEKEAKAKSPKRKTASPRKSVSKKMKSGSPTKSPLEFKSTADVIVPERVQKVLDFEEDNVKSLDTMEIMRGPAEVVSLDDTLPPLMGNNRTENMIDSFDITFGTGSENKSPFKTRALQMNCTEQSGTNWTIIDVTGDPGLYNVFLEELKNKSQYSISVAMHQTTEDSTVNQMSSFDSDTGRGDEIHSDKFEITGIAFCWGEMDSYYVNLTNKSPSRNVSVCTPAIHPAITMESRVQSMTEILQLHSLDDSSLHETSDTSISEGVKYQRVGFDVKKQWKALATKFNITIDEELRDCKIAAWILDPESEEPSLMSLVSRYIPEFAEQCGLKDINVPLLGTPRTRACLEALLVWHLHQALNSELKKKNMLVPYREVECPLIRVLARMELNGMGFSKSEFDKQYNILKSHLNNLERLAHKLSGTKFSLSSMAEVSDVLFVKLHLPTHDPSKPAPKIRNKRKFFSTSKEVLTRLAPLHPLPSVIMLWRKISAALSKTLYTLENSWTYCKPLNMYRVYTSCITHSATGRVSFHLPNLQNMHNNFSMDFPDQIKATDPSFEPLTACPRNMFVACDGCVLLAADYSQLELRLMCHLSGDRKLRNILNSGNDVFRAIAAEVNNLDDVSMVTDQQRQHAKQICYGILYGMGAKSLAQELECEENEASEFIERFKNKYSGLKTYISNTILNCQSNGFVKTILNRVRYLPNITSENVMARAKAERQCVNTTTQGSGADVIKVAMVNIDRILQTTHPDTCVTHAQRNEGRSEGGVEKKCGQPGGAYLVLQLHDELIYEVNSAHLKSIAKMVKYEMENAVKLKVKMPVQLKVGRAWGEMDKYNV